MLKNLKTPREHTTPPAATVTALAGRRFYEKPQTSPINPLKSALTESMYSPGNINRKYPTRVT